MDYILKQTKFSEHSTDVGIEHLIHKGVFLDAFPLHDGPVLKNKKVTHFKDRKFHERFLSDFHASLSNFPRRHFFAPRYLSHSLKLLYFTDVTFS